LPEHKYIAAMDRRCFAAWLAAAAAASFLPFSCRRPQDEEAAPLSYWERLLKANDEVVVELMEKQERLKPPPARGGLVDQHGLYHAMSAAAAVERLTMAYTSEMSDHHQSERLMEAMRMALEHLLHAQHPNGSIDLIATNFQSTPDTAFVVEPLAIAAARLEAAAPLAGAQALRLLETFLRRAGEALCVGGIHTPNHRWVIGMALARLFGLYSDERYRRRAETWLAEGIDIDPDGQYSERSVYLYSPLTNRCLIAMARAFDRIDLLEPVRRNLELTLYLARPNGELTTEVSTRQDQASVAFPEHYFFAYWLLGRMDGDARFAAMADWIYRLAGPRALSRQIGLFMELCGWVDIPASPRALPVDYRRYFPHSKLLRIRRGDHDASIMAGQATFFTFSHGPAVLKAMRLASAFFGKGQFVAEELIDEGARVTLRQSLEGPYYQPLPPGLPPDLEDWNADRERREKSEVQTLHTQVTIAERAGGFTFQISIEGAEGVPIALELVFREGGRLTGARALTQSPGSYVLEGAAGRYEREGAAIVFGPGHAAHSWTRLRGALPPMDDALSVYLTGISPWRWECTLGTA
jgi:hypothetical protein